MRISLLRSKKRWNLRLKNTPWRKRTVGPINIRVIRGCDPPPDAPILAVNREVAAYGVSEKNSHAEIGNHGGEATSRQPCPRIADGGIQLRPDGFNRLIRSGYGCDGPQH